jgi:hypothetical protein
MWEALPSVGEMKNYSCRWEDEVIWDGGHALEHITLPSIGKIQKYSRM